MPEITATKLPSTTGVAPAAPRVAKQSTEGVDGGLKRPEMNHDSLTLGDKPSGDKASAASADKKVVDGGSTGGAKNPNASLSELETLISNGLNSHPVLEKASKKIGEFFSKLNDAAKTYVANHPEEAGQ